MNLNLVETTVSIAGNNVVFSELTLNQKFNAHHHCEIWMDYDAFGDKTWMADPVKIINLISESLVINFTHKETGDSNIFIGIVKNVRFSGYHGAHNQIVVEGTSETVKMEGMPNMDSFVNKTLESIVNESVANSGNGAATVVKPDYKKPIDLQIQYSESCWSFLSRLAFLYGESLYSKDGSEVFFGKPELDDSIDVMYDRELTHFDLKASLAPPKFKHFNYLQFYHEERQKETRKDVPEAAGYLQPVLSKSEMIYTSDVNTPVGALVHDSDSLLKMVDIERTRSVGKMLVLSGTAQTCKIGLGRVVTVTFPGNLNISTSPGAFVVTEITHTVDKAGHYENNFSGTRAALDYIPMEPVALPVTAPQRATVLSNADPEGKGRIKVQFQWQKSIGKETNWLRVVSPDAGGTGHVTKNRGYVFIPEVGDDVMIQFEDNDPARPYCSGSLFPETIGRGGGGDNHLKTIMTRSGHTIALNDEDSSLSITIKDRNGNIMHFDTVGKNITITAPETITMNAKNVRVNAEENITMSAGKDIQSSAGENISESAGETHTEQAKNKNVFVQEDSYTDIKKNMTLNIEANSTTTVTDDVNLIGGKLAVDITDADAFINATGKITLKSGDIVDIAE